MGRITGRSNIPVKWADEVVGYASVFSENNLIEIRMASTDTAKRLTSLLFDDLVGHLSLDGTIQPAQPKDG